MGRIDELGDWLVIEEDDGAKSIIRAKFIILASGDERSVDLYFVNNDSHSYVIGDGWRKILKALTAITDSSPVDIEEFGRVPL